MNWAMASQQYSLQLDDWTRAMQEGWYAHMEDYAWGHRFESCTAHHSRKALKPLRFRGFRHFEARRAWPSETGMDSFWPAWYNIRRI